MAEIIKVFKEEIPAMRFIGKKYPNFGPMWGEWFANGWFNILEEAMGGVENITAIWENGGGYVGLERRADGQPFEYWIGMFTTANTTVPDGFSYVDFSEVNLGTCWIYGKEKEVHNTKTCTGAVFDQGFEIWKYENGGVWSFENCTCPRYTTPDEQGNIIMDYCYFIK